jgi:tetratricopeptide (TPR) repeat protein
MRAASVLLAILASAPLALRAQEPACALRCRELAARGELMEGLSQQGCTLRLCHEAARQLYVEARYDQAFAALEVIDAELADSPAYQLDRGLVEYARGRLPEALSAFDRVLEREPDSLRGGAQRAHALMRLERLDEARAQFEKLLVLPVARTELQGLETTSYLHGNLGALRLMQNDAAGARSTLAKALELDRGNSLASTYLYRVLPEVEAGRLDGRGVWLMMLASEDAALAMLARAGAQLAELLGRAPKFAEAYYLQGDILRAQRQYESCETALRRGEEQLPGDVGLRAERLRCQLLRHGPGTEQARPVLVELVQLSREHPENERVRNILLALRGS